MNRSEVFNENLKDGNSQEERFEVFLQQKGILTENSQGKGSYPDWDVSTTGTTGQVVTYEVKFDRLANQTGNVAVEMDKVVDGHRLPAALSTSKSNWYVYTFTDDPKFYLIPTKKLRRLVDTGQYKFSARGGNGGYFINYLFDKEFFLNNCHTVDFPKK